MPGRVTFAVQDNGKGFRPAEVRSRVTKGIGLASMQERVRMMGGKLNIWSREGAGTKITFTIPVKAK
jgi:two-component system sensor histidine kinase DegS